MNTTLLHSQPLPVQIRGMMPSFHLDTQGHLVDPGGHLIVDSEGHTVGAADLRPMHPLLAILLLYGTMCERCDAYIYLWLVSSSS